MVLGSLLNSAFGVEELYRVVVEYCPVEDLLDCDCDVEVIDKGVGFRGFCCMSGPGVVSTLNLELK